MIPAVLYGNGKDPVNVAVAPKAVKGILQSATGRNTSFAVEVDGGESVELAILADFQKDPVRRTLVHCDILRVDPGQNRRFKVPIVIEGEGEAHKLGAKIRFITRDIIVVCKPGDVPDAIVVDGTALGMGDTIRVAEIAEKSEFTLLFNQNAPILTASSTVEIIEEDEEEEEEALEGEEGEGEGEEAAEGGDEG